MAQSAAQSGHGNKACLLRGCGKSINRRRMPVKDFSRLIGTLLRVRMTLKPFKRAAKRRNAGARRASSPHIRHFGLRPKQHSAADT